MTPSVPTHREVSKFPVRSSNFEGEGCILDELKFEVTKQFWINPPLHHHLPEKFDI